MSEIQKKKLARIKAGKKPAILDLFAGAGGLSLGFYTAGFDILAAVEIDSQATETHALNFIHNHPEETRLHHSQPRDITIVDPDELISSLGYPVPEEAVDVIVGGPPCQAFARVGRAKLREVADHPEAFLEDPRANLYLRFLDYVRNLQPLVILMENVPDALNFGGHNIAEETCEVLSALGYNCAYTLLNSVFYGVPQMRDRMFLLAYTNEIDVASEFPVPTHYHILPPGYHGTRSVALKSVNDNGLQLRLLDVEDKPSQDIFYKEVPPPSERDGLQIAVSAREALDDLPRINALDLLEKGLIRRGVKNPLETIEYTDAVSPSRYACLMRNWRSFEAGPEVTGHIIRYLPRDYKLFARLEPGDQYPEAYQRAMDLFSTVLNKRREDGDLITEGSEEFEEIKKNYVPPYDPGKFPNKWRKMEPDEPARTLMAHIGKDSYSHIHYDDAQARTISVREAARLQSFPDGFIFAGKMNAAFRQIGNAVPPLLAYALASKILNSLGQEPLPIMEETECASARENIER